MSEETVDTEGTAPAAEGPEAGPAEARPAVAADAATAISEQQSQSELPKRHLRKTRVGQVVSNRMDKTIVVAVIRRVPHPKFGKITKRTKKLYAHDAENQCEIGDLVRIEETRPLSRLKRWQLVEVLKH
jgi:small subunit ribosomal protein S17